MEEAKEAIKEPTFEIFIYIPGETKPKKHFKIYYDGRIEGFEEFNSDNVCIVNRQPAIMQMALSHYFEKENEKKANEVLKIL